MLCGNKQGTLFGDVKVGAFLKRSFSSFAKRSGMNLFAWHPPDLKVFRQTCQTFKKILDILYLDRGRKEMSATPWKLYAVPRFVAYHAVKYSHARSTACPTDKLIFIPNYWRFSSSHWVVSVRLAFLSSINIYLSGETNPSHCRLLRSLELQGLRVSLGLNCPLICHTRA